MIPTPTTRPRHALRWVLGVGLVFVVVVGLALQAARARADERWLTVGAHCEDRGLRVPVSGTSVRAPGVYETFSETRGGNIVSEWRQRIWTGVGYTLVLRQEQSFFGSTLVACMSWRADEVQTPQTYIDAVRDIFAAVEVELVVEP